MLLSGSSLNGFAIAASDGRVGAVDDFLFDDKTWKMRWLVVDAETWLTARMVLVHPSAMGRADYEHRELPVRLTTAQVKASPDIREDEPVSREMENNLQGYDGWCPEWGNSGYQAGYWGGMGIALPPARSSGKTSTLKSPHIGAPAHDADPHLRSIAAVIGTRVHATDGLIGHVEDILFDSNDWRIRYLVVDTRNWWPGKHVLMSPDGVEEISWSHQEVRLNVTRNSVRASPPWDTADLIGQPYEKRLHSHYGWPGRG